MMTIVTHGAAFVIGVLGGAWAWNRYKAKAAADLAKLSTNVGK